MSKKTQSRKWQLTINNPLTHDMDHEAIKNILKNFAGVSYWVMSDEIGENCTPHTHIFMYSSSPVRFSTIKKWFPPVHIEIGRGTCEDNRNYIYKLGKWGKDAKHETNIFDTHEEFGQLPLERQGQRNDIIDLYDMIKSGLSNFDIMEENPQYMLQLDKIEKARQIVKEEKYKNEWRDLTVTYIYGRSGTGKTRSVMEKYGYSNVYRVTDYDHPWDGYQSQDVVVFEEFRSSLKISDMLNYLDGYPLTLSCRYLNRVSCFTQVYIITNLVFDDQFKDVQRNHPETWLAFCRRIGDIICRNAEGVQYNKIS
ncbi:viral replication protein [Eubacterium aggregans]|uniref:viral replication protein n=1 Tax=Eubacterium aggregans TaxID=81409 RepID=UPI003F3A8EB5